MRIISIHIFRGVASLAIAAMTVASAAARVGYGPSMYPAVGYPAQGLANAQAMPAAGGMPYGEGQNPYATQYMAQNPYAAAQEQYAAPQGQYGAPQGQYAAPQGQYAAPQGQYAAPQGQYPGPQGTQGPTMVPQGQYPAAQNAYASPQAQYAPPQDSYYPAAGPIWFAASWILGASRTIPIRHGARAASAEGGPNAQAGPDNALPGCVPCVCPWTFCADELFLQRTSTRSQTLFVDPDTGADLLNSQTGLNFPVAVGFQVSGSRQMCDCWSIDVGYMQLDGWNANHYLANPSVMVTDVGGPFFPMDNASARYTSAIYLGEINVRQQTCPWLTLLAGFRMGELDERYRATGTETFVLPMAATLTNNAFNHLYGFQVGADVQVFNYCGVKLNGLCKGGIYDNAISQNSQRQDLFVDDHAQGSINQLAFLGEAGLTLSYEINEHFSVHATYQAVWITGLALAPEQIPVTDFVSGTTAIDSNGSLLYHGGGVGLEVKF